MRLEKRKDVAPLFFLIDVKTIRKWKVFPHFIFTTPILSPGLFQCYSGPSRTWKRQMFRATDWRVDESLSLVLCTRGCYVYITQDETMSEPLSRSCIFITAADEPIKWSSIEAAVRACRLLCQVKKQHQDGPRLFLFYIICVYFFSLHILLQLQKLWKMNGARVETSSPRKTITRVL